MTINQVNNLESALSVRQKINLTIDKANSVPDNMTATWNNSGEVFTGIKLSITDTASDSESSLMNLFVDGNSQFKVGKDAGIRFGTGAVAGAAGVGLFSLDNTAIAFGQDAGSASWGGIGAGGFVAAQSAYYGWGNSTLAAPDLFLFRDAANNLAQRNGTNAQTFNIYNTYTDASNYERGFMKWDTNVLKIGTGGLGTGAVTPRALELQTNGTTRLTISATGAVSSTGGMNLGASGVLRTRYINNGDNSVSMFDFDAGVAGAATFSLGGSAPLLRFGGATSSFPALKRSTTSLQVRLADDSGFADFAFGNGSMTPTWNDAGTTFTGLSMNVTDTASASGSLLMDLQVGGVSQMSVAKDGDIYTSGTRLQFEAGTISIYSGTGGGGDIDIGGVGDVNTVPLRVSYSSITVVQRAYIGFTSGSAINTGDDTRLYRDAANTLAQRNSTNAQAFNIYNTYTDASNYERGFVKWNSNVLEIGTEALGTGTARDIDIKIPASGNWAYVTSNVTKLLGIRENYGLVCFNDTPIGFEAGETGLMDAGIAREAAGVLKIVADRNATTGGSLEFLEQTAPAAGSATSARIFAEDDGSGNTRLMALFGTGSAKAFAGEDFQTVKSDTTQAGANTASINNIVTVTQAEYDLLTPDADTVYFITA